MDPMPGRRHCGIKSQRGVGGNLPFVVRCRDGAYGPTAGVQAGKWYRGIVKEASGFMARWHRAEVGKSWLRHENEDAKKTGEKEKGGGGRRRGRGGQPY